jgi:hypothetical protein
LPRRSSAYPSPIRPAIGESRIATGEKGAVFLAFDAGADREQRESEEQRPEEP